MKSPVVNFIATLTISISITFIIHLSIIFLNELPLFENKIVLSYIINFILALSIFITLYTLKNRFKTQIGMLFLGGSLLKFLFFFIFFYPEYKRDGELSRLEFAAFFIPYLVCLTLDTLGIIKLLKKMD